jgi:hypothetical protein
MLSFTLRILYPQGRKALCAYRIGGWVDYGAGLDVVKKGMSLAGIDHPAYSPSFYRLSCPYPHIYMLFPLFKDPPSIGRLQATRTGDQNTRNQYAIQQKQNTRKKNAKTHNTLFYIFLKVFKINFIY